MAWSPEKGVCYFHPLGTKERDSGNRQVPKHREFICGACGQQNVGRIVCDLICKDQCTVLWCLCACDKQQPTIIIESGGEVVGQMPLACDFHSKAAWPPELARLYDEATKAYAAGAHTAASMVCRKLLMSCACHEKADDNKTFAYYVDYITDTVLTFPRAKTSIDAIRSIGNEANHDVQFVGPDDAKRALQIVTYMLDTIYTFPAA